MVCKSLAAVLCLAARCRTAAGFAEILRRLCSKQQLANSPSLPIASFDGGSSFRNLFFLNKRLRSKVQIREAMFDAWG